MTKFPVFAKQHAVLKFPNKPFAADSIEYQTARLLAEIAII
jgi:hypothetical protein